MAMCDLTPEPMTVTAIYSLLAFLVGLLAGSAMKKRGPGKKGKGRRPTRRELIEIYAGNLSYDVGRQDLTRMFKSYGEVASARIIKNQFNGKSKGYGFLEMVDRKDAAAAIRALNGKEIKGRKIVVNEAKSNQRSDKQRRGRRG